MKGQTARATLSGPVWALTVDDVSHLTGLTYRQLAYWDRVGLFSPHLANDPGRPFSRVYTFRDLVGLRTLALLIKHTVSVRELREVGKRLEQDPESWTETPWASLTFYVGGRHVYFDDPATGQRRSGLPPEQHVWPVEMVKVALDARQEAGRLRDRTDDEIGKIAQHRNVVHNASVVAGTRVPTRAVWNLHHAGYDETEIIYEYPRLTQDDVRAAIAHEQQRQAKRAG